MHQDVIRALGQALSCDGLSSTSGTDHTLGDTHPSARAHFRNTRTDVGRRKMERKFGTAMTVVIDSDDEQGDETQAKRTVGDAAKPGSVRTGEGLSDPDSVGHQSESQQQIDLTEPEDAEADPMLPDGEGSYECIVCWESCRHSKTPILSCAKCTAVSRIHSSCAPNRKCPQCNGHLAPVSSARANVSKRRRVSVEDEVVVLE